MSDLNLALGALTGGGVGALDAIDGAYLNDGDAAVVILPTGVYYYHLNSTSSAVENSPFRINPDANAGTKSWHLVGTTARIGALVEITSNVSLSNAVATNIDWDVATYDDADFWEGVTNPSRLTIPIGVNKIKVTGNAYFAANSTGYRQLILVKNGTTYQGKPTAIYQPDSLTNTAVNLVSPLLSVSATDYFEFRAVQASGGALNLEVNDSTWFSIEAVGFA